MTVCGHEVGVDVSIGIALYPEDGHELGQLIRAADLTMYEAERAVRRRHRLSAAA